MKFQIFLLLLLSASAFGQNVYRERLEPHWLKGGVEFWYRNDNKGGEREFILVNAEDGTRKPAFDHEKYDAKQIESLEFNDGVLKLIGRKKTWEIDRKTGEERELDGDAELSDLPSGNEIRNSRGGGPDTQIVFENTLDLEVELMWIDPSGGRRSYGKLAPGEKRDQHTFAGHVWAIFDSQKRLRGVFEGRRGGGVARIAGPPKKKPTKPKKREPATEVDSPDRKWAVFVRDNNLWIRNEATDAETQLTKDASGENSFHRDAIRDRAMGMNYNKPDYP
ncbi:MAG: DPP IV N-terminal domain-containing protein, partial [Verrucomicrobiota bacterium]